jgi:hypothetical protein
LIRNPIYIVHINAFSTSIIMFTKAFSFINGSLQSPPVAVVDRVSFCEVYWLSVPQIHRPSMKSWLILPLRYDMLSIAL